jgi:hypothetical protein
MIILTWIVISVRTHYLNLTSKTKKYKIDDILDRLLENDENLKKELNEVKKELKQTIAKSQFHLQKIGLVRFNPFERIAGEQSFVVSLVDEQNSGIVINFIYTHDGLRAYTKKVKYGKGEGYELSEEEKKAIKESK